MSFWSTQKIINNPDLITNFDSKKVKEASYTLTVGDEAFITSNPNTKLDEVKKLDISEGVCYIPPGQFAYLITAEEVNIPDNCLAFISMKFSTKAAGLVNVSGFHVDPGYSGKLIFAVYNAGVKNILIRKGMDIFLIWFSDLDEPDVKPKAKDKKGFVTIPDSILEDSQDAETLKNLSDKVSELEVRASQSSFKSSLLLGLLLPLNLFIFKQLSDEYSIDDMLKVPSYVWLTFVVVLFILLFHIEFYLLCRKIKKIIFEHHLLKRLKNILRNFFRKIEKYSQEDVD
jgi:dCTP deaminase